MKSAVTKPKQTSGASESQDKADSNKADFNRKKEEAEKKVLQDKLYRWIKARVKCLDPGGYQEEIDSLRYFGRNAPDFTMGIVAIVDLGRRYLDKGLKCPILMFPQYLFTPLPEAHQVGATSPCETIPAGQPWRRCLQPEQGILEMASDGVAVLDG